MKRMRLHVAVVNLPRHALDRNAIQREMRAIGERPFEESDEQH
ncbi:hypothetical protein [Paraburkholderia sp.]